ncbi:MAG: hypothetical protein ACXW1P_06045 [Methylophilaceae bacterium]
MAEKSGKPQRDPMAPVALFMKPSKSSWKQMLPIWIIIFAILYIGIESRLDTRLLAAGLLLFGLLTSAFSWLLGLISVVPLVGSPLVKVLGLPVVWLLNALGYVVSFVAIRRGYSQDVLTYRGLTVALIIGIIIGYVLGRLI